MNDLGNKQVMAKNILKYMKLHDKSRQDVCQAIGVKYTTFTDWVKGKSYPRIDKIELMARYFGITKSDLIEDYDNESGMVNYNNVFPISTQTLPVLGKIACGTPKFMDEDRSFYVKDGTSIKADFVLIAYGDSMVNARINDGDLVFIRQQPTVDNGEIAAVAIGDEATLKRIYYYQDKSLMILKAENPKYEDMIYSGEELEDVRILGKAVAFQSDVY